LIGATNLASQSFLKEMSASAKATNGIIFVEIFESCSLIVHLLTFGLRNPGTDQGDSLQRSVRIGVGPVRDSPP
jgi:hypothetical protein